MRRSSGPEPAAEPMYGPGRQFPSSTLGRGRSARTTTRGAILRGGKDSMTISNLNDPSTITGAPVRGSDGEKLGKVDAIYYDDATDAPEWAAVKSGLFGGHVSLVPLAQASWDGDALTVPFDKAALEAAPHHDPDAAISATDEDELYRHYGLTGGQTRHRRAPRHHRRARHRRPRHLRPHHRRGDDSLRGEPAGGHRDGPDRPGPAAQARGHRAPAGHGAGHARRGHPRARADHRGQPRRGLRRSGHLRGGARGHAARRAPRGRCRGCRRRAGQARQGDRHRAGDGGWRGPQGADRARRPRPPPTPTRTATGPS